MKTQREYDKALQGLPTTGTAEEVLEWIGNHPVMGWHARLGPDDDPIVLTVADVLKPPHGPAPCRMAATQLQYFVNRPEKFFDKLLDKQVKDRPADGGGVVRNPGLENIAKMREAMADPQWEGE